MATPTAGAGVPVVDPDELPGDEPKAQDKPKPAPKPAAKPKAEKKAPEAKKPAAEKPKAEKPAAKPKASKPAPKPAKPKAEKKPAGPKLPVGTKVKYLGGSKADWLKKGATGEIKSIYGKDTVRYGVKFAERSTVIAAKFVEKA